MALIDKQITKIIDILTKESIIHGKLPSTARLTRALTERADRINGGPTFRSTAVNRFDHFDVVKWNKEMSNCEFDIQVMYEELVAQAILLMRRTGWTDTIYRAQRGQLDRLIAAMDDILFTKQNAEDHFLGFSETFTDFSKIDLQASTEGVLSLTEKALVIPPAPMGTKRIKMEDKTIGFSPPVVINSPAKTDIIKSATAADSPFINIFNDISLIWRHDVITRDDNGCEIQITFPVNEENNAETLTRVSVVPVSENEMLCKVLTSFDGHNYTVLPSQKDWTSLSRMSREVSWDFERINVRWIRVVLRKETADETVENGYRYSFGIKNFAIYNASRLPEAIYQTINLVPQVGSVEKVVLETNDYIPGGCFIDYYIADETGEFLPISPLGKPNARAPLVIRFGDIQEVWNRFSGTGDLAYSYNSVNYYRINQDPFTGEYRFGMTKLYRGRDAWSRETNLIEEVQSARDVFIQFTNDEQKLYTYKNATVTGELLTADDETQRTVLSIPSGDIIYYDRNISGHTVRPAYGVNPDNDQQPTYAVAEVLAIRSDYTVTGEVITISTNQWTTLSQRNLDENTRPEVYLGVTALGPWGDKATEDNSYKLEKWPGEGDYLTGKIKATDAAAVNYARVTYTLRRNITHLVTDVDPVKGKIWLAHPVTADKFIIRYRVVPDNIVRKSIVITQRRGEDQGDIYREGSDYLIDVSDGTISRPEGSNIQPGGSCYVDFQWIERKYSLETYSVWCYYDRSEPGVIEYSPPSLDLDGGETFYMDINGGRKNLLAAKETPILSRGWYRFTCESKSIDDLNSGIRKILALKDGDGNPIFSGTAWFSEIRAFRSPMFEVSEAKLKYGTRKGDHSTFAIDLAGHVIVNFNPGEVEDITTLLYDENTAGLISQNEKFELLTVKSSGQTARSIKLRVVLRRNSNVDPGTTPKVFGWAIRLSR